MPEQEDGCYPRVNGGMIQSNQFNDTIVSLVGRVIAQDTLQTSDGTNIVIQADYLNDGLLVNPDLCVEVVGQVNDATCVSAFVSRELSTDMDLKLYDEMIKIQNSPDFCKFFSK